MALSSLKVEDTVSDSVEIWKMKKLIKSLESVHGNGNCLVSLILSPNEDLARISRMLNDEAGCASCIKSRSRRLEFIAAMTSVQKIVKSYDAVPPNGLVIYQGTDVADEGKEERINIHFEPFRPISTTLFRCDSNFYTETLTTLLTYDNKFGFIVMDSYGTLFGTLSGNTREVLHKFTVDMPRKCGRGGASSMRFARLRLEKRNNYIRKVAEMAVQMFITNDEVNCSGLYLAGTGALKTELSQSDMFDLRLQKTVVNILDVSYSGESGFNQAVELNVAALPNVIQEKKLIGRYFDEISQDTGRFCFGVDDTLKALEMGAVDILIVWENLDITRYVLKNHQSDVENIQFLTQTQENDTTHFLNRETGAEFELQEQMPLLEWFTNTYKNVGAKLEIVTDRSQEGAQFVKGYAGIGGILLFRVDFSILDLDDLTLDDDY